MPKRVTIAELTGLDPKYANFVIEYTKDWSPRRAAEASGFAPDSGYKIAEREDVAAAVQRVIASRLESSHIDAEWVIMEAVDNHLIARQMGNINASNTALSLIAKHKFVDAFAAEKVMVTDDKDVMERLLRGRQRARGVDITEEDPPSFI